MGERCGAYRVFMGNMWERDHLKGLGLDGRIILKWIFKKWNGSVDWVGQAHGKERWCVLMYAVMALRFP